MNCDACCNSLLTDASPAMLFANKQGQAMDFLPALLAFAAGFLTCLLMVAAAIWWSFSDRRVRETKPVISKRHERRAA